LTRTDAALAERTFVEPWGLQDVAAAAGMSPGGFIRRFGSKEGLQGNPGSAVDVLGVEPVLRLTQVIL